MADFTYGGAAGAGDSGPDLKRIVNLTAAAVSAALVAGLVWWAWSLVMRDVHGVPVVRALEGAMRETPVDPGGAEASHQGLAVAVVQAEGMAAPPPAEIVLAPRPPVLLPEDLPVAALQAAAAADAAAAAPRTPEGSMAAGAGGTDPATVGPGADGVAEVVSALLPESPLSPTPATASAAVPPPVPESAIAPSAIEAALAEALGLPPDVASPTRLAAEAAAAGIVPASVPGVARSPRPAPRPEGDGIDTGRSAPEALVPAAAPAGAAPAATAAAGQPWLSRPAPGVPNLSETTIAVSPTGAARVVQLGAFDTPAQAEAEWQRLAAAHADLLGGRAHTVEQAVTNGRTFFRLRAGGFDDLADARRFCVALVTNGAACIPVPQ